MFIGNQDTFKQRSLYRTRLIENKKRICKNHFRGFWGKNPKTNEYYPQCYEGKQKNEVCVVLDQDAQT